MYLTMRVFGTIDLADGNFINARIQAVSQMTFTEQEACCAALPGSQSERLAAVGSGRKLDGIVFVLSICLVKARPFRVGPVHRSNKADATTSHMPAHERSRNRSCFDSPWGGRRQDATILHEQIPRAITTCFHPTLALRTH